VEHHYAQVNGIRLHYAAAGAGPLMLFIHGWPDYWQTWEAQIKEFSRDHRAVAPDTRGVNLSERPQAVSAYGARHLVEDMRQLIAQLGGRAIVVAHDWGGAMAWNLAAQHPDCVEKLVIINSPNPLTFARELAHNSEQQAASRYMLLLRDPKAERVMSENGYERMLRQFEGWQNSPRPPCAETLERYRSVWSQPGALTAGLNYYRASPLHPPMPGAPGAAGLKLDPAQFTVRVPTLVIWGEQDSALRPGLLDGLEQYVTDLRIARIPEGSHWVVHEYPERVNALIREFISS
jgi:pimeloyl-ACP methyl ester carboxylesterase